jgi:carboxymethylenebutenolidase
MSTDALIIGDTINGVPVRSRQPHGPRRGVVVLLHPGPGLVPPFLEWLDVLAAEGYVAIAPQLFHRAGRETYDPMVDFGGDQVAFADALPGDALVEDDVDAVITGLGAQGVAPSEIGLLGFSYGARATFLLATTKSLGAAVSWYPVGVQRKGFGTNPDLGTIELTAAPGTPWLGLSGERDFLLQPGELDEWEAALSAIGSDRITLVRYPTAGHGFDAHGSMGPGAPDSYDGPARDDGLARTLEMFNNLAPATTEEDS